MYRGAEFDSTFSDRDAAFNEDGDPIRPGARALAEAFADSLRRHVPDVREVVQHEYYGWGLRPASQGPPSTWS